MGSCWRTRRIASFANIRNRAADLPRTARAGRSPYRASGFVLRPQAVRGCSHNVRPLAIAKRTFARHSTYKLRWTQGEVRFPGVAYTIPLLDIPRRGRMADLDQFLAETTASGPIPGVSLATLHAGARGPEYHFGIRGVHDHFAVDPRTVFEAASLTKPVVAFIALQIAEEGLLDLHRPPVGHLRRIRAGRFEVASDNGFSCSDAHERSSQYGPR